MPWKTRFIPVESGKDWAILKQDPDGSWHIVGRSATKSEAEASIRARAAGAND